MTSLLWTHTSPQFLIMTSLPWTQSSYHEPTAHHSLPYHHPRRITSLATCSCHLQNKWNELITGLTMEGRANWTFMRAKASFEPLIPLRSWTLSNISVLESFIQEFFLLQETNEKSKQNYLKSDIFVWKQREIFIYLNSILPDKMMGKK